MKTICFFLVLSVSLEINKAWSSEFSIKELNNQLFKAVSENNLASVRASITAGANTKTINAEGLTPAGLAIEMGYFNIAHYILGVTNQKPEENETDTAVQSKKATTNYRPPARSNLKIKKDPNALLKRAKKSPQTLSKKHAQKWPKNKPNPFSPNTRPRAIPIIGSLQKSPIQSMIPGETINLDIKMQESKLAPLKTPSNLAPREVQAPTPIQPLNKGPENQDTNQTKGFFTKLGDIIKSSRPKQSSPATKKSAPKSGREKNRTGGFINNMWQKITSGF